MPCPVRLRAAPHAPPATQTAQPPSSNVAPFSNNAIFTHYREDPAACRLVPGHADGTVAQGGPFGGGDLTMYKLLTAEEGHKGACNHGPTDDGLWVALSYCLWSRFPGASFNTNADPICHRHITITREFPSAGSKSDAMLTVPASHKY